MPYWVLTISAKIISCVTVQRMTQSEMATEEYKTQMQLFNKHIKDKLNAKNIDISDQINNIPEWNRLSFNEDDPEFNELFTSTINDESIPEADDAEKVNESENYTTEAFDNYINMEVGLPRGDDDQLYHARVKRRAIGEDGKPIGVATNNPLANSIIYEVEFMDGITEVMTANIIAENILAQVDDKGHRQLMLNKIIDHRIDDTAIMKEDTL